MKLSQTTKTKAAEYISILKAQVEEDLEFELKTKTLGPLRQVYETVLHTRERAEIYKQLSKQAEDLGYSLQLIIK